MRIESFVDFATGAYFQILFRINYLRIDGEAEGPPGPHMGRILLRIHFSVEHIFLPLEKVNENNFSPGTRKKCSRSHYMRIAESFPAVVSGFRSDVRSLRKLIAPSPTQSANLAVCIFLQIQ